MGSPRARVVVALGLVAVAWCSAGLAPLRETLTEATTPTDFARDYVAAHAHLRGGPKVSLDGEAGNDYAASIEVPRVVLLGGPYYIHPLPALLPVLPLVALGYPGASLAWLGLSLVALGGLSFGLVTLAAPGARRRARWVGLTFAVLLLWPPVLHNLAKGQWSILLACALTLGWMALERRRGTAAGAWLGAAASIKATPLLLFGYLALRQRRAAAAFVATLAAVMIAAVIVGGVAALKAWAGAIPSNVAVWQTWVGNTASLNGLTARLLIGGTFARPLVEAPLVARALGLATSLGLVSWVGWATWRTPSSSAGNRALGAAWIALVVVLNPLGWTHTLILALPALALLRSLVPTPTLLVALALMSVPRQTLAALAGPTPTAPAVAPLLSLHAAALLLFVAAGVRAARRAPAEPTP